MILGWVAAALVCLSVATLIQFFALAAFNCIYTRLTNRSWRKPFAVDAPVSESRDAARDHRARVAGVLLHAYLAAYLVAALAIAPLPKGRLHQVQGIDEAKGILAVLAVHLAWVLL